MNGYVYPRFADKETKPQRGFMQFAQNRTSENWWSLVLT